MSTLEEDRLSELKKLVDMEAGPDAAYDDITRMAAALFDTPIALISLVDGTRQWFLSRTGLAAQQTPREQAFCAVAIQAQAEPLVVRDATLDPRFTNNPLVTGEPNIRFYAGAPLVTSAGHALGTVCVIDTVPRDADPRLLEELRFLSQAVVDRMERAHRRRSGEARAEDRDEMAELLAAADEFRRWSARCADVINLSPGGREAGAKRKLVAAYDAFTDRALRLHAQMLKRLDAAG